ncbi:hypothetical protein [Bacillus sp. ISL-41]|nr:hypothetical protein [Bacillus sp. ISL-41]
MKKALSIAAMETGKGCNPEKSVIHRGDGDMKRGRTPKKRHP